MSGVVIHEVGPRDGLQNEPGVIGPARKLMLIRALAAAGMQRIEVGAFVSPAWVPQMADTDLVLAGLAEGPSYAVLVPNMRGWQGFEAAQKPAGVGIAVFVSATEGFSRANLNVSISDSLARLRPVVEAAGAADVAVRGYISCVTDCPFDGPVAPGQVAQVAEALRAVAPMQLSLGDTIGKGDPERVSAMIEAVAGVAPVGDLAGHFHDTDGRALLNVEASLALGVRQFDAAVGGLGGCPYAPGAPGNLATERLVAMLHGAGFQTGVDEQALGQAVNLAQSIKEGRDAASEA